jgi:Tfp pilus assembly protein PilF
MAAKVNTKFVIALVAGLIVITAGGATVAKMFIFRSGAELASMGDKAAAKGDIRAAEVLYSKAVNKEQTVIEYKRKWLETLRKFTPENQTEYEAKYRQSLVPLLSNIARLLQTDVAAQEEYLGLLHRESISSTFSRDANSNIAEETSQVLLGFGEDKPSLKPDEPAQPWHAIRRYRGLALLRNYVGGANMKDEEVALARWDLETALKARPQDAEVAAGLEAWYSRRADIAAAAGRDEDAAAQRKAGRDVLNTFAAASPNHPEVQLARVRWLLEDAEISAANLPRAEQIKAFTEMNARAQTVLDEVAAGIAAKGPAEIDTLLVSRLLTLERVLAKPADEPAPDGEAAVEPERAKRTEDILRKLLEAKPDDADALHLLSQVLRERDPDAAAKAGKPNPLVTAQEVLSKIIALPSKPISPEGMRLFYRKLDARFEQASFALRLWEWERDRATKFTADAEREKDEAKKAELRALAKASSEKLPKLFTEVETYRNDFQKLVPEDFVQLLLLDAQIAFSKDDYGRAQRLIGEYNKRTEDRDSDGLWLMALASEKLNQPGLAKEVLEKLAQRPGNTSIRAALKLGEIAERLRNFPDALKYYKAVAEFQPGNTGLAERIANLEVLVSGQGTAASPEWAKILEIDKLEKAGKSTEALATLKQLVESSPKPNPLFVQAYAGRLAIRGDRAGAAAILKKASEDNPTNTVLKNALISLTVEDPIEARLQMCEVSTTTELDKFLCQYETLRATPRKEDAAKLLASAAAIAPDNPLVLEFQFLAAVENKDTATAERIAESARAKDLDRIDGASFYARIALARGDLPAAVRVLEAARSKPTFGPEAGRLLGQAYAQAGRYGDAATALRDALTKRPDDVTTSIELIRLLSAIDRRDEALAEARERQRFGASNPLFADLWLGLEAAVGDREDALRKRRDQLERDPGNRDLRMAVAALLTDLKRWEEARLAIDAVRKDKDGLDAVSLDARWYAEQGRFEDARKAYRGFIDAADKKTITSDPYIGFGLFLISRGRTEEGLGVLDEGRAFQTKDTMMADRALADSLAKTSFLKDSVDAYRRVIDGNADTPDQLYRKRLIDVLMQLKDGAAAAKELASLGDAVEKDPLLLLQSADAAFVAGDEAKSQEIIEKAVEKFPGEALVYVKRAQSNAGNPKLRADVMADLDRAIQLRPDYWQALSIRANMHFQAKPPKLDECFADLRAAVRFNPNVDQVRVQLIRLLLRADRVAQAVEVADEVIAKRKGDTGLVVNSAELMLEAADAAREAKRDSARSLYEQATRYYQEAYRQNNRNLTIVIGYLKVLQNGEPPNLAEADRVLNREADRTLTEPGLLMARAKQFSRRNKPVDATRDAIAALKLIKPDQPRLVMAWFADLQRVAPSRDQVPPILDAAERDNAKPEWIRFFRLGLALESKDEAAALSALGQLDEITKSTSDRWLKRAIYGIMQARYYQLSRWDDAIGVMRRAVAEYEDDWEMHNNLAFTIVKAGKDPKEAVPLAERAARLNPESADANDTLGWVLLRAGRTDDAEVPLVRALNLSGNSPARLITKLHMAELRIDQKRIDDAHIIVNDVENDLKDPTNQTPGIGDLLAEVKAKLPAKSGG